MLSTTFFTAAVAAFSTAVSAQHGASEDGKMGPVGFLWPEDRAWNADHDNTGPCGSVAGVTVRTEFPITGGAVALTIDDDAWDVSLALSTSSSPTKQSDFTTPISSINTLDGGHQCYALPSLPTTVKDGDFATIQLQYTSTEDDGKMDTFYACADIKFVAGRTFTATIPCFNVTSDEFELEGNGAASTDGKATTTDTKSEAAAAAPAEEKDNAASMASVTCWGVLAVGATMFGMLLN